MTTRECVSRVVPRPRRATIAINLNEEIIRKLKEEMHRLGEDNFSRFVEGIFECFLRDTCDGCPAYEDLPQEEKTKITGKVGVGKWITDETE
jgi:hypothetical protein